MHDEIYFIDPVGRTAAAHSPVSFAALGIQERGDLQEWILSHPEILGEPLLIITSEFAGFDRSNRRLDLLALDPEANLVVIELKLSLSQTFADLQALRYAAFCSTMTTEQVIGEYAKHHRCTEDEASEAIGQFLGVDVDDLPEPSDRPRIVLVAGSMDEPEVVSTVLWLRNFDLDIQCLEVTPYRAGEEHLLLIPRLIVPLPEAEEYQVRVERKESVRAKKERAASPYLPLWKAIAAHFGNLDTLFEISRKPTRSYFQIAVGQGGMHYEWQIKKRDGELHVAIHFESGHRADNMERLKIIQENQDEIGKGVDVPFRPSEWGKKWAYGAFICPLSDVLAAPDEYAPKAASLMDTLMRRTWPLLRDE